MKTPVSAFTLLCLVAFIMPTATLMSSSIIAIYSQDQINASVVEIGLIVSAFSIASVLLKAPIGLFLPVVRTKMTLILGIIIITASFLGYAITDNVVSMTLIRIFHGVGETLFQVSILIFLPFVSSVTGRVRAIGRYTLAVSLGLMAGPGISTFSVATLGMRGTFFLASVLTSIDILLVLILVRKVHIGVNDFSKKEEVLPSLRRVLSNRDFRSSVFAYFAVSFVFSIMLTYVPSYARNMFGFTNEQVTLLFFGYYLVMSIVRFGTMKFIEPIGKKRILPFGLAYAICMLGLMAVSSYPALFAVAFSLQGLSMGVVFPIGFMMIVDTVDQGELVLATSLFMLGWDLGQTAGPNILSSVVVTLGVPYALAAAAFLPLAAILICARKSGH